MAPAPAGPCFDVDVELDGSWGITGRLHGGYLLATLVGAAMRAVDPALHPHPVGASALYVSPPAPGHAVVRTVLLRAGRSVASYRVLLQQAGRECVEVLLTAGRLPGGDQPATWTSPSAGAPHIAQLEDCRSTREASAPFRPGHLDHVDLRLDPATARWAVGDQQHRADYRGWCRLAGWDAVIAQYVLADAMPPATFDLGLPGWVPTLQLQVLLRRVPTTPWQQIRQTATLAEGGLLDEDCTLWDPDGRVTVQSRQLAAFRPS